MGATMRPLFLLAALAMVGLSWACAPVLDAGTTDLAQGDAGAAADAGALDAGVIAGSLAELTVALRGDFDNAAQVAASGVKRVERHVCPIPGRDQTADLAWLYVEHVEDLATGQRDAYFTRFVQLTPVDGGFRSRAYKFVTGHPLATNAFAYNGPRDGCWQPAMLQGVTDADLAYRAGCDVDFQSDGDGGFTAATSGTTCAFPGGYIQTRAHVFPDGLDSQDTAVSGGSQTGDLFQFRRVLGWTPPDAG
jgi:hypothetical protein